VNALWNHQVAIISGDFLYSRSVMELARVGRIDAIMALANASNEMSIGELRQLVTFDALDFSEEDYRRLISCKTASLMGAACEIGALVGAEAYRETFRRFGHALGMAFQIADDLLDYEGSEEATGKPVGHDLRERKVTLPLIEAMRRVGNDERSRIRDFFTRIDPTDEEIATMVDLVRGAGGLEYAREQARSYAERAEAALRGSLRGRCNGGTPGLGGLRSGAVAVSRARSRQFASTGRCITFQRKN
jgi:octaprenyl-diphosphate synthase